MQGKPENNALLALIAGEPRVWPARYAMLNGNRGPPPAFSKCPRRKRAFHHQEAPMGSATDKIKGYANQAAGSVKQGVGKVI